MDHHKGATGEKPKSRGLRSKNTGGEGKRLRPLALQGRSKEHRGGKQLGDYCGREEATADVRLEGIRIKSNDREYWGSDRKKDAGGAEERI